MNGKGSRQRPFDARRFRENYDRIFRPASAEGRRLAAALEEALREELARELLEDDE